MRMLFTLTAAFLVTVSLAAEVYAATPEVRGTWLTTGGPDHIASGNNTATIMGNLRDIGLNTVYVETWKNGYTNFPSPTLANITSGPDCSPFLGNRDLVEETTFHAHRNELNYVGWFEYGFSSQFIGNGGNPTNPISTYMKNNGWLLQDVSGNYGNASNGFAWMNPAVPEVRQFLIDIVLETVETYDLDGVQFDDRLAWPKEFGWDATTKNIYQSETGNVLPNNPNFGQLNQFNNWRQEKVKVFAQELYSAVKAVRPDMHVSVSPSITPFSATEFMADWPTWVDEGIFDEYTPQVYRSSIGSYLGTINAQVTPFEPNELDKLVVGLRSVGTGAATPYADLEDMIEDTRTQGAAGHSIWYSLGVHDLYKDELTAFYDVATNGQAASPIFGAGHRPAPLAGTFLGAGVWAFDVPVAGGYQIVGKVTGGDWESIDILLLPDGTNQFFLPGIIEAEIMVDYRPGLLIRGDLDGDGFVGINDLNIILANWNTSVPDGDLTQGDTNDDGFVGIDDLNLILSRWNTSAPPPAFVVVPEPGGLMIVGLGALGWAVRRR